MAKSAHEEEGQRGDPTRYLVRLTVRRREAVEPSHLTAYGFIEPLIAEGLLPEDITLIDVEIRQHPLGRGSGHHTIIEIYERDD